MILWHNLWRGGSCGEGEYQLTTNIAVKITEAAAGAMTVEGDEKGWN